MDQIKQSVTSLEHNLKRSNGSYQRQQKGVQKALDNATALRNQIKTLEAKVEKQRKAISQTEEERDHYLHEATEQAKRVEILLDEVRDAESLVFTYRKDMKDLETQLKQQQNLYSAVRNDRTGLAKNLTEAHDEISDLKGKLRVLSHQFDQLKEEVEAKEASLVKEGQEQAQLAKEKDELVIQVDNVKAEAKVMAKAKADTERSHKVCILKLVFKKSKFIILIDSSDDA
jgi:chromosome segregation ATPase